MRTYRLQAAQFDIIRSAAAYVAGLARPPMLIESAHGNVMADIGNAPQRGAVNNPRPLAWHYQQLYTPPAPWLPRGARLASLNYYPPGGGQGWHTDTHNPAWRIYVGHPVAAPGRFITREATFVDEPGVGLMFEVTGDPDDSWHAIWAPGERYSVGLMLTPELAAHIRSQLTA